MSTLDAVLTELGIPWYLPILEEEGLDDPQVLDGYRRDGVLAKTLVEIGVTERDAETIEASLTCTSEKSTSKTKPNAVHQPPVRTETMTLGSVYSEKFLSAVLPLYDMHMGAENIGPLLYSYIRFTKPQHVLEVGAGYTSLFLLQALADNAAELNIYQRMQQEGTAHVAGVPWCVDSFMAKEHAPKLHCIDNMAHEFSTAGQVAQVATELGLRDMLTFYESDAFDSDLPATLAPGVSFDTLWVDLGAAHRIGAFIEAWWPRVSAAGGSVLVHSTLTNELTRNWLESMRQLARSLEPSMYGAFECVSLLEPHKMFQNSVTVFKKRGDVFTSYTEPVYTKFP